MSRSFKEAAVDFIFSDDASIFHAVKDPNRSAEILNHDRTRISEWAYIWKMSFNADPSK